MTYREYHAALATRAAVVSRNALLRIKGRRDECQPLPPKPEWPKVPVAYTCDGDYEGRLADPADCPARCVVRWERAQY